jgi:hypothetical protein
VNNHQEIDQRSLALHRLVCEKIRNNPELFDSVKKTLARWKLIVSKNSQPYLDQWQLLVDEGLDVCLAAAVEDSERGASLRQASPFTKILTNQERFKALKDFEHRHAT